MTVENVIHRYPHSPGNLLDYHVSASNDRVSSMEGNGLYIDTYGFKHEKSNENDRLQYICVKLSHFYDLKAHSTEEHVWRTLVKSYQNSSAVPVGENSSFPLFDRTSFDDFKKNFKCLVRQGIPSHLRPELWHMFIQKQTQQLRKEKGATYFQNLCHLLPNSDVRESMSVTAKATSPLSSSSIQNSKNKSPWISSERCRRTRDSQTRIPKRYV